MNPNSSIVPVEPLSQQKARSGATSQSGRGPGSLFPSAICSVPQHGSNAGSTFSRRMPLIFSIQGFALPPVEPTAVSLQQSAYSSQPTAVSLQLYRTPNSSTRYWQTITACRSFSSEREGALVHFKGPGVPYTFRGVRVSYG